MISLVRAIAASGVILLAACDPSLCSQCQGAARVDCTLCDRGKEDCPMCVG
ncbi:MAG: hypothetical protein HYY16_13615, partial [Planctomycetes bacterium]|nr:hypothetical protein [Planctomycetota bacterium]